MARLDAILLAGVGILLVHQAAYTLTSLSGDESSIAHGHLQSAWLLASLGVLGALTRSILRSIRRRARGSVSELSLFAAIANGYLSLEMAERVWDGQGAFTLFTEPVIWVGLALAPLVALALAWSLRSIETAIARFIDLRPQRLATTQRRLGFTPLGYVGFPTQRRLLLTAPLRGPPIGSFT